MFKFASRPLRFIFLASLCMISSCGPKVFYLIARPCTTITKDDSVRFSWKVRGTPTLLSYQEDAGDPENPGKRYEYYKLVAKKGKKDSAFPVLGLTILPDTSVDYILINTVRTGDSAVAKATRDTLVWGRKFTLDRVASASGRSLTVIHLGNTAELDGAGQFSTAFKGLPNSGPWEFRIQLTEAEKKDSSRIPGRLMVKTIIIHQRP
jgi:hypothetical protein